MIDEASFMSEADLRALCDRLGELGLRTTASQAHEKAVVMIEDELTRISGVSVEAQRYEIVRWRPVPEGDLESAGELRIGGQQMPVVGAVPYARPGSGSAPLVRIPRTMAITAEVAAGRIVVRDFPQFVGSTDDLIAGSIYRTADTDKLAGTAFERPGRADLVLHLDLLAAGQAGAAGLIFVFDLPREQMAGYFDPHKGTHYAVPAVYVGGEEAATLRLAAEHGADAMVTVHAVVDRASTRNVVATMPGSSPERISIVTHTDGNTWVQENGAAALLALLRYFAGLPSHDRQRTLEFVFASGHLHISREGSRQHAELLDQAHDGGNLVCAITVEHLGAREVVPLPTSTPGLRVLEHTGGPESLLWSVGDSPALRQAVERAVAQRELPQTFVLPGLGPSVGDQVPPIASFGGIGTYFHTALVPTTGVITGPYSLWAPSFGRDAIDCGLLRRQALAIADVVAAAMVAERGAIQGEYGRYRRMRAAGQGRSGLEPVPPEIA